MRIEALTDADSVARAGAAFTVAETRPAVVARSRFIMAVSGGRTPWQMRGALADEPMPRADVHVVQVDERVAPNGDPERNLKAPAREFTSALSARPRAGPYDANGVA